ncbi:MAG: hypothetical protein ACI86M_003664 [Saprospiraceae bacterium]|jgi:hypothetical protein
MKIKYWIGILTLVVISCANQEQSIIFEERVIEDENFIYSEIETIEIVYSSDDLEITGYIHCPKTTGKFPLVIYNRGGNRNLGAHSLNSFDF